VDKPVETEVAVVGELEKLDALVNIALRVEAESQGESEISISIFLRPLNVQMSAAVWG
jgi:hypothetical protein